MLQTQSLQLRFARLENSDQVGNARPAFLMRLFETKVSADCHKVY